MISIPVVPSRTNFPRSGALENKELNEDNLWRSQIALHPPGSPFLGLRKNRGQYSQTPNRSPFIGFNQRARIKQSLTFANGIDLKDEIITNPMNAIHSSALGARQTRHLPSSSRLHRSYQCEETHDHSNDFVTFNVSGQLFQLSSNELEKYPSCKLSQSKRAVFYDHTRNEYFIDRHRRTFEVIASYINSGKYLLRPDDIPIDVFVTELAFYDLGRRTVELFLENEGMLRAPIRPASPEEPEASRPFSLERCAECIWRLCENPESSLFARIYSLVSVMLIFISIAIFCAETTPIVRCWSGCDPTHRKHHNSTKTVCDSYNVDCSRMPLSLRIMRSTEDLCLGWFSAELFVRFIVCPSKAVFCKQPLNVIDAVAVFPSLVSILVDMDELAFLKTLRFNDPRALRILKMARYSRGLRVLGQTIIMSKRVILLQCAFHFIMATTFGACFIYLEGRPCPEVRYCENGKPNKPYTIIDGLWWAVITMTTVGYGDVSPTTYTGKLLGAACSFVGTLGIAFPIPVVVAHFNFLYNMDRDDSKISPEEVISNSETFESKLNLSAKSKVMVVSTDPINNTEHTRPKSIRRNPSQKEITGKQL